MKKIYMLALAGLAAVTVNAQRAGNQVSAPRTVNNPQLRTEQTSRFRAQMNEDNRASYWLCYALQLDDPNAGPSASLASADFMLIFPDSNIIVGQYTTGETAYPQFHKGATMLDPKNMPVQGISASTPYMLDSVGIVYGYLRNTASSVTDTLQVQIIRHDASLLWDLTNATYQDITYTFSNNSITQSQVLATYNILLTESDSSNSPAEIFINTSNVPQQAAGNRIGVVVSYKPGYTYTATDSIQQKNSFYVFSYENNGLGTDPTFYGIISDGTSDMNCSYALPVSVRYDFNPNGWNGYFIPEWAYTTAFAYENHIIEFKVSEVVGIEEANLGLAASTWPNPANNEIFVGYSLKNDADVTIEVTDLTGRVVMSQREGDRGQGEYRVALNTENLAEGTYIVNVRTEGAAKVSSKIVVKH
ncbi:MAG: T9SS type A sorting domain-containing protein [Bacteroidetes bacterium]|nr:T9SS type A sorting domain-containing protein [Bacteroidota bacterium]